MQVKKKAGITIHISGKIDFKTKHVTGDKEETKKRHHFIMIRELMQQEDKHICTQHKNI